CGRRCAHHLNSPSVEGDVEVDVHPDNGPHQHPHNRRPTMKPNQQFRSQATRQATVHPITAHPSIRSSIPVRPDDGHADIERTHSSNTERLVLTVDEAAYLLSISRAF